MIVEPRATGPERQKCIVYHPLRRDEWFAAEDASEVVHLAPAFFRHYWKRLDATEVEELLSNGKDRLISIAFSTEPKSLLDLLPSRKKDPRARASAPQLDRVIGAMRERVWSKLVRKEELADYQERYIVLSTRLIGGQPLIHVHSESQPDASFAAVDPDLEDVYFQRLRQQAVAA